VMKMLLLGGRLLAPASGGSMTLILTASLRGGLQCPLSRLIVRIPGRTTTNNTSSLAAHERRPPGTHPSNACAPTDGDPTPRQPRAARHVRISRGGEALAGGLPY
jgi:hypothetical protein